MTGLQLYILYCEEISPRHELNHRSWDDLEMAERWAWERIAEKINMGDLP